MDKSSATASPIFRKEISFPTALFFAGLCALCLVALLPIIIVVLAIDAIFGMFKKSKPELTYEQAHEWFKQGKGYYQNLPEHERKKFMTKKPNLPLGL